MVFKNTLKIRDFLIAFLFFLFTSVFTFHLSISGSDNFLCGNYTEHLFRPGFLGVEHELNSDKNEEPQAESFKTGEDTLNNPFPVFPEIAGWVAFWKNIFAYTSICQVLIHDKNDPELIYEILEFPFEYNPKFKTHKQDVETAKLFWQKILEDISKSDAASVKAEVEKILNEKTYSGWERGLTLIAQRIESKESAFFASQNIRSQKGLRENFIKGYKRSGRYAEEMKNIFKRSGLPEDLYLLPHVESSFNPEAKSKAGAMGMWQFTKWGGKRYLTIGSKIDQRMDPLISTQAAANYLLDSYHDLGTWPLALTSYNHGVYGIEKAITECKTLNLGEIIANYSGPKFGFASSNFYAEFLAVRELVKEGESFLDTVKVEQPVYTDEIILPDHITLKSLARHTGIDEDMLMSLNPSFTRKIRNPHLSIPKGTMVRVPHGARADFGKNYVKTTEPESHPEKTGEQVYTVKRGDNLQSIARKFNTTVISLMESNSIPDPDKLRSGQKLRID